MKRRKLDRRSYHDGPTLLIDGHSLAWRAIYSRTPELSSPDGEPTRGTFVFVRMFLKLLSEFKPKYIAVAIDGPRSLTRRRKIDPEYKRNRRKNSDPEEFQEALIQLRRMFEIVRAWGLPVLEADDEADDIIATLVGRFSGPVTIVSRDKDLMSLVSGRVDLYDALEDVTFDERRVRIKFGVDPTSLPLYLSITGDRVDGIPGVRGLGPKAATKLLDSSPETLEELRLELERSTGEDKLAARLLGQWPELERAYELVRLNTSVDLDLDSIEPLRYRGLDRDAARSIFEKLGFTRFARGG